jgi:hypothetical protein
MPAAPKVRHQQNVEGPFYVVEADCMACGAPEMYAPKLMSHDSCGQCFFARQPASAQETNDAIAGIWASCCGAVRYGGKDHGLLFRLAELGLAEECDFRLKEEPKARARTRVSFEFAGQSEGVEAKAREITTYLADFMRKSCSSDGKVRSRRIAAASAAFVYEWGYSLAKPCRASFAIELPTDQYRWRVLISREDGLATTGFAIMLHKALTDDSRFRSVQWFTDDEQKTGPNLGQAHPY